MWKGTPVISADFYVKTTPSRIGNILMLGTTATAANNQIKVQDAIDISGWSVHSGTTYRAPCASEPTIVYEAATKRTKGSGIGTLNANEWFWAASVLYFRDDAATPSTVVACGAKTLFEVRGISNVIAMSQEFLSDAPLDAETGFSVDITNAKVSFVYQ